MQPTNNAPTHCILCGAPLSALEVDVLYDVCSDCERATWDGPEGDPPW